MSRFPHGLPEFFIRFLTDPGDLVVDPFAGSNIAGEVAERLGRRWLAFEVIEEYLETSKFRFPGLYEQSPLFAQAESEVATASNASREDEAVAQPVLLESKAGYKTKRKKRG